MRPLMVAIILSSSSIAAAQAPGQTMSFDPEPAPPPVRTQTVTVSYRSHILASDALSFGTMLFGPALTHDADMVMLGVSGYALGAPIVHLAHGRGGAAAKSFALRATLPIAAAFLGYKLGPDDTACVGADVSGDDHAHGCVGGSLGGMLVGVIGGTAAAIYIDARYLATYEATTAQTWSASISRTRGGAMVGIGRAF